MALSQNEQRMLAEIEHRLAADDPKFAARMSSFKRPGPARMFRSVKARIIGSLLTVVIVGMISLLVYAVLPFRSGSPRPVGSRPSGSTSTGQPVMTATGGGHSPAPRARAGKSPATAGSTAQHGQKSPAATRPSSGNSMKPVASGAPVPSVANGS